MSEKLPTRPAHVLEDPSALAVARVYSTAYLNAGVATGVDTLDELEEFVSGVLEKSPDFAELLSSPLVTANDKLGIVERVVAPKASEMMTSFFRVLARHDRLDLLSLIAREARREHQTRSNQKRVIVKSAVALSEEQQKQVSERLKTMFSFEPILEVTVDPTLLGGLVIQVGDTVYDSSLRTRMRVLRTKLRERYLNEIQSGRDRFRHPEGN